MATDDERVEPAEEIDIAASLHGDVRVEVLARGSFDLITEVDSKGQVVWEGESGETGGVRRVRDGPPRPHLERIHPDDREHTVDGFIAAFRDERDARIEYRVLDGRDSWCWLETTVSPFRTASGEKRALFKSRDITATREMMEQLRESEERYRQLVESSPEGVIVLADEKILYVNPAGARIVGAESPESMIGSDVMSLIDASSFETVTNDLQRVSTGADGLESTEFRIRRADGERRDLIGSGALITYEGRPAIQGVARDITEWKQAERDRERLHVQLQEANKLESLGLLAGGIAHDFNNLLAVILGNVRFAASQLEDLDDARAALNDAANAGESAARLTRQLLAYAGRRAPEVRNVDLSGHARSVSHLLEAAVPKKIRFELDLFSDLPAVRADVVQFEQVTMNLVLNAAEAIGDAEGRLRVATGSVQADASTLCEWIGSEELEPGEYVYLEVSDTGCGIDNESRPRIFDPFFTTKETGHGLGLSAVLGLVRGHGGGLSIDSRPGEGTAIRVYLPVTLDVMDDVAPVVRASARIFGTVLVVDDEPLIRSTVRRVLASPDCDVLEAADGVEALDLLHAHADEIDLVLLDVNMPRAGGEETLRGLRLVRPDLPVLLTSGFDESVLVSQIADDPHAGFIEKPFVADQLSAKIEALLSSR